MATTLAKELGCDAADLLADLATVDSAVKAEKLEAYLDEKLGVTVSDETSEANA